MVSILHSLLHRLEMDAWVLTLASSFLDCSGYSAIRLLQESSTDPEVSESTRQLVEALSSLEKSRGKAAGHLLSGAITLDANLKLVCHNTVLNSAALPDLVAREA